MNLITRAAQSVQARCIIPHQQAHFERTEYGKRLAQYQNRYAGRRCFFVGNGPSLRADDLTRLHEAGELTFAFNRIYNIFDQTPWRPTFYISQDEKMLAGCVDEVRALPTEAKFIPIQMKWWHALPVDGALYFNLVPQPAELPQEFCFSDEIAHEVFNASTGMYTAAQLAAYMGFAQIVLIGVDHHFRVSQNDRGEIVVDSTAKDYFTDKYNEDKDKLYIPNTERSTLTYLAMKRCCDARGIRVHNATRGGKLEVFERVAFDELL